MNRTECTLMDAANKIEKHFLSAGLPMTLDKLLTSEEYETFRFALKDILPDNDNKNWDVINRIYQKVDRIVAEAPMLKLKLRAISEFTRKESSLKVRYVGFETTSFNSLLEKVNEFINSDECVEFIEFDFKTTERNINNKYSRIVYSGFIKYRAPIQDEDKTKCVSNDVKAFASEVRKTIEDTYQSFGGSERFDFCDHGLALIEAVQSKLDEVLK